MNSFAIRQDGEVCRRFGDENNHLVPVAITATAPTWPLPLRAATIPARALGITPRRNWRALPCLAGGAEGDHLFDYQPTAF